MFHLSWKPRQGGRAESEEKLSVQEKPSFWSLASLGSDTAADDKWRKWHKGNSRGRPLEDETELASGPLPVACGWSKLETDRTGEQAPDAFVAPGRSPSQTSQGHSNRLG